MLSHDDNNLNDQKIDILFYKLSDLSSKLSDVPYFINIL